MIIEFGSPNSSFKYNRFAKLREEGMSSLIYTRRGVGKPDLFPLGPSLLTLGVTARRFSTYGGVCLEVLEDVLAPLEEFCRTNCCSAVELEEVD